MSVVTIDVVPINGEPMWHAIVNGREYLERSGRKIHELVSRLTVTAEAAATVESAQD